MIVFVEGQPKKSDYRKFKIACAANGQDDYASMREMLTRRVQRYVDGDEKFAPLPNAFMIDGGLGHVHVCKEVLDSFGLSVPCFGMVKDDRHRTRALVAPDGREFGISATPALFALIGRMQEEVHRFAIEYNRKLGGKKVRGSTLDKIPGVGDKRRTDLLKHFGSIENIRQASEQELAVLSSSMEGKKPDGIAADKPSGFNKGDLIVAKYIGKDAEAKSKLGIGDVISFRFDVNNDGKIDKGELNTHRIVDLVKDGEGNLTGYITKGDNNLTNDANPVYFGDIVAVYSGRRLAGIGNVLTFLSSKLGFALCIILPLFLFFAYELFVFFKTLLTVKNEGKKVITAEDEELIKQRAIEEYLRRQQESASAVQGSVQESVQDSVQGNDADNADN